MAAAAGVQTQQIIIVDDDPGALASLRFLLESEGYSVQAFTGGPDLIAELRATPGLSGSLIILDFKMPDMDGIAVYESLRDLAVSAPVILVTGHPDPSIARRAEAAGLALFEKPLSQDMLLNAVRRVGCPPFRISP